MKTPAITPVGPVPRRESIHFPRNRKMTMPSANWIPMPAKLAAEISFGVSADGVLLGELGVGRSFMTRNLRLCEIFLKLPGHKYRTKTEDEPKKIHNGKCRPGCYLSI